MICNFFNKVRFLTNKLKLLIFMKKPFLHLHLSLLFLMGCVFLLPSCIEDKAEDAAHRLVVSKVDVELIQTGMLNTGSKASFDVLANRGYVITSDAEWLDVDKPTGKGRVSVTLEAKPNETPANAPDISPSRAENSPSGSPSRRRSIPIPTTEIPWDTPIIRRISTGSPCTAAPTA